MKIEIEMAESDFEHLEKNINFIPNHYLLERIVKSYKKAKRQINPGDLVMEKDGDFIMFGIVENMDEGIWSTKQGSDFGEVRKATPEEIKIIRPLLEEK